MEVAAVASSFALHRPMLAPKTFCQAVKSNRSLNACSASLSTSFVSPISHRSVYDEFSGLTMRPSSLNPSNSCGFKRNRDVVAMAVPLPEQDEGPPPDLPSHLFNERIVYLGTTIVTPVFELLTAELLYLQYESMEDPVYFYINSTGTYKGDDKFGNEVEALALYDIMRYIRAPIYTLCVGNAWGEAALLLAAGDKGHRYALPSASIMIRQPIARFQGQASAIDMCRETITGLKKDMVRLLAKHIGKTPEQIEADIERPKYFSPSEAVEYGIIDKVLLKEKKDGSGGLTEMMNE